MSAISISNTVDYTHREEREQRYLDIIGSYDKKHQELFPEMLAQLVLGLDEKAQTTGTEDILGLIFHELELHSVYSGQFFTPPHISDFMAKITCGENDCQDEINERGYITVLEPACGSGVMVLSFCKAMREANLDFQRQLVVTAVDVDAKCAFMTYIQLALYGVPAVIIHGNSLTCEEFSRYYTPFYILNGWLWRQKCGITTKFCKEDEMLKRADPMYAAFREMEVLIGESTKEQTESIVTASSEHNTDENRQLQLFNNDIDSKIPVKNTPKVITLPTAPKEFGEQINLFDFEGVE